MSSVAQRALLDLLQERLFLQMHRELVEAYPAYRSATLSILFYLAAHIWFRSSVVCSMSPTLVFVLAIFQL